MSRKSEIFESVLTSAYDNNAFVGFVQELLNNVELVAPNAYKKIYNNFSYYVDGYYHIGNYTGNDGGKIAIFSVALKKGDSVERARTMQRNFVKPLLENGMCAGALVTFYTPEEPEKWRLSFIRLDYEFSKGKVTEKLTPARRYSYLVGKGEPCNTAKQRLFPIFRDDDNNPDIDELEEAFSVEKVTNEFFQQYCEKYHELREYLEANTEFMQEAEIRHFTSEQFAKKLLGQIVFLYFIQKKGWLGVDAIPVVMTEKDYKNAFFARGQKSRDIVGSVYAQQQDGTYRIVFDKLKQLSDEDEEFLAGIVKGKPWGTGPKDFMRKIFEGCKSAGKNYFDDYLEPLFYTGLNVNRGCFRVNMYRNTEIAKESMNTATSSEDTLQNDASNEKVRDKFGINEEIRNKFGINEEVRKNYGETAANILCLMLEKPENTLDSIANTLGVTRRTVEKQVKKLKEVGIVSRVGSNKSGSWKVDIKEDRQL